MLVSMLELLQDEILFWLLFGWDVLDFLVFEMVQIVVQLLGYFMFNLINELWDWVGVDCLCIILNVDGMIVVIGGYQISDDVYLEIEIVGLFVVVIMCVEWLLILDFSLLLCISDDMDVLVLLCWWCEFDQFFVYMCSRLDWVLVSWL